MEQPYDLMGGILSTKADERMIGFAGFMRPQSGQQPALEGIVKVSAFHREDGSGYLTLTFVIDHEPGVVAGDTIRYLRAPDQAALQARLGRDFEMLMDMPLTSPKAASPFRIEEMDVYFRSLRGQERAIVESRLFPALGELLGLQCEALQAWQAEGGTPAGDPLAEAEARLARTASENRPRSLWRRLFGGGG
ncbi:hypothetical protein JCM19379_12670 [Methyloparacoccus murrellii]|jgi:hypothetical protein